MKKVLFISCAIVVAISILFMATFAVVKSTEGENVSKPYFRFTKKNAAGDVSFNWSGLICPLQLESQKMVYDTVRFTQRVPYPIAPSFQMVEPSNRAADTIVAQAIAKAIKDSIESIQYRFWGNIDNRSLSVRRYIEPNTPVTSEKSVSVSLTGTASPEAEKYGFAQSIEPGNLEQENDLLAKDRLLRTKNILVGKLMQDGIGISKPTLSSYELQLTQTQKDSVLAGHKEILDRMRYVEADVTIATERLVITPITAPVLLPLWIALLAILIAWLRKPRKTKEKVPEMVFEEAITVPITTTQTPGNSWMWILIALLVLVGALLFILFWRVMLFIVAVVGIIALLVAYRRHITAGFVWVKNKVVSAVSSTKRFVHRWRPRKRICKIIVTILLIQSVILIGLAITWATGHLHFN